VKKKIDDEEAYGRMAKYIEEERAAEEAAKEMRERIAAHKKALLDKQKAEDPAANH